MGPIVVLGSMPAPTFKFRALAASFSTIHHGLPRVPEIDRHRHRSDPHCGTWMPWRPPRLYQYRHPQIPQMEHCHRLPVVVIERSSWRQGCGGRPLQLPDIPLSSQLPPKYVFLYSDCESCLNAFSWSPASVAFFSVYLATSAFVVALEGG